MQQPIAVLYEHPEWFKPLFAELDRRDVPYVALPAVDASTRPDELSAAVDAGQLDFGIDNVGLLQEHLPAQDETIVRIEIVGGRYLYAIRLLLSPGSFNLCPADYCELPGIADGVSGRGLPIEAYDPPATIIEEARGLVAAAGMDVGGVEYLVNATDGRHYFYDVNALSNFVADAPNVIGFNPYANLVDLIVERAGRAVDGANAADDIPGTWRVRDRAQLADESEVEAMIMPSTRRLT